MITPIPLADLAKLAQRNAGAWVKYRRAPHNRISAVLSKWRRHPPAALRSPGFEFRVKSDGYGTGETWLLVRFTVPPITSTLPLDDA